MHPVIEHLLARKDTSVPTNDGRKTALVLFGGLMTGARGAGAVAALEEMGLAHAFDDIYTISAGFPNAAYFLTENTHEAIDVYCRHMCSKEFINLARVWDIVNINFVLKVLKELSPLDYKRLSETDTDLHVRLLNLKKARPEYKSVKGMTPSELEGVMHAAISLPYLNPGSVELEDGEYKDAGTIASDMVPSIRDVLESDATDILIIYNRMYQYEAIRHAGIIDSDRLYQIVPYAEEEISRICTDSEVIRNAALRMGNMVRSILGSDKPISLV